MEKIPRFTVLSCGSSVFWSLLPVCIWLGPFPLPHTGQPGGPEGQCIITGLSVSQPHTGTPAPHGHASGPVSDGFLSVSGADGCPCLTGSWESEELRDSLAQRSVNNNCDHYDFEGEKARV